MVLQHLGPPPIQRLRPPRRRHNSRPNINPPPLESLRHKLQRQGEPSQGHCWLVRVLARIQWRFTCTAILIHTVHSVLPPIAQILEIISVLRISNQDWDTQAQSDFWALRNLDVRQLPFP